MVKVVTNIFVVNIFLKIRKIMKSVLKATSTQIITANITGIKAITKTKLPKISYNILPPDHVVI